MKDIRSWRVFGREASVEGPPRTVRETALKAPGALAISSLELAEPEPEEFSEPTLVLDPGGGLIAANAAARALGRHMGVSLDEPAGVERFLAKARPVNGGGAPPWSPVAGTDGFDAIVSAPEPWPDEQVFELRTTLRAGADGRPAGWVVRLLDITPLIAAVRGQKEAAGHRDTLLKLLSHDMRSPLAAILATLKHPDLGVMPANLKQIIENAARRALHMVDSNARLIRARSSKYTFVELDFCHVVEEVVDATWSLSKEAGVKVVLEPANVELSICADRGSLTEALTELISKLIMGGGAGRRLVCVFSASALREKPAVTLTIAETGEGVGVQNRFQTSRGLAALSQFEKDVAGEGAGLDFFKTIIARHSGTTICETEFGSGRSVSITIPIVNPLSGDLERRPAT